MGRILHFTRAEGVDGRLIGLLSAWRDELPFDVCVIEGVRTNARQMQLYEQGRTTPGPRAGEKGLPKLGLTVTNARTVEKSAHGHAGAIDAMPLIDGRIIWDEKHRDWPICQVRLETMADCARRLGIVCGADWTSKDLDHFEVKNWRDLPLAGAPPRVT